MNRKAQLFSILTVLALTVVALPAAVTFADHNLAAETASAARYEALADFYSGNTPAALASAAGVSPR